MWQVGAVLGTLAAPWRMATRQADPMSIDADFSSPLNDRTGKLFRRGIISPLGMSVASVSDGRLHDFPRGDLARQVAGRLTHWRTAAGVFGAGQRIDRLAGAP